MSPAAKFLFGTDFREERRADHHSSADLAAAREEAYAQGLREGEARARADREAALLRLVSQMQSLEMAEAERVEALEAEAARLAALLAKKLAAGALGAHPLAEIEAAARDCLAHGRNAPHLAVRVAESMVEDVDRLFARLGRETGYAGKVVVLGDPETSEGDARMEWADGGIILNASAREAAVEAVVARVLGTAADGPETRT